MSSVSRYSWEFILPIVNGDTFVQMAERLASAVQRLATLLDEASGLRAVVQTAVRGTTMSLVQAEHDAAATTQRCREVAAEGVSCIGELEATLGRHAVGDVSGLRLLRTMLESAERLLESTESMSLAAAVCRRAGPCVVADVLSILSP